MLTSFIVRVVRFSTRHALPVILASLLLCAASVIYVVGHFAINTDISGLIDPKQDWARRGKAVDAAFPSRSDATLIVVEAGAAEFADQAAAELAGRLAHDTRLFRAVTRPGGGPFFDRNALLFASRGDVERLTGKLGDAAPLLERLARDPSLRGLANVLSVMLLAPLQSGQVSLPGLAPLFASSAQAIDAALAGRDAAMSWRALVAPETVARSFVEVLPVPNYGALEAGAAAAARIRAAAGELQLAQRYGARVSLTGERPLADDEFASVSEGAVPNAIATLLTVLIILWFAVRSARLIVAVFVTLLVGLAMTAALGLLLVGALNMISVAFAVLFVGIGVDFGIQFAVRYREERHALGDQDAALESAARAIAMPLSLAAAATAASFFCFLPTAYRGVAELGLIAGVGILCVAFPSSLTLLPALITVLRPPGEPAAPGFRWLAPADRFAERHRRALLVGTLAIVIAGLPLLARLHFDFNPLHLKDPHSESMATLQRLSGSPEAGVDNVHLLAPTLAAADQEAARLVRLPEVGRVMTLSKFVPADQPAKLAAIAAAAARLDPALAQDTAAPADDNARISALRNAAGQLENAAEDFPGPGAQQAQHLAASLRRLAAADVAARERAEHAVSDPLRLSLATLRALLHAVPVTAATLPADLRAQWLAADGRAFVDIAPRVPPGVDPGDDRMLRAFSQAVLRAAPDAIGGPISILHSADTIIRAFLQAGALALLSITVLLWLALRNFGDVLRTLVPLLVSAAVALEISVLIGLPLNFANIIALPLLLGIGVAFKIYYVIAWRNGRTGFLASGLTQAVVLSAATTATAFGSLWLSHHPGTSSMGKLLALSLACTLVGAVFFQPVLMGRPRHPVDPGPTR
jgi:hopanoid biosynthesis associated RND transporter like protein HpnN